MTKKQASKKPTVHRRNAKEYPYMGRWFTAESRMYRIVERMRLFLEGPATRSRFQKQIDSLLDDVALAFCQYLYAEANGIPVAAAEDLEELQGLFDYELPVALLQPIKNTRDREKALKAIMPTLAAKIAKGKKLTEDMYIQATAETNAEQVRVWGHFRLKKPLVRPAKQRFQEFSSWVDFVMTTTLEYADRNE